MQNTSRGNRQRGAMDWGAVVTLIVLLAAAFAMWNVGPVYVAQYQFEDAITQAARAYPRTPDGNKQAHDRIWKKAQELALDDYMYENDIEVSLAGADRVVRYSYQREATVLPGWKHTFKFEDEIRQPLL